MSKARELRDCYQDRIEVEHELNELRTWLETHPLKPTGAHPTGKQVDAWLKVKAEYHAKREPLLAEMRELEQEHLAIRATMDGVVPTVILGPLIDRLIKLEERIADVDPDIHIAMTNLIDWLEDAEAGERIKREGDDAQTQA